MKKGFVIAAVALILFFTGHAFYFTVAPDKGKTPPDYSESVALSVPEPTPQVSETAKPTPESSAEPEPEPEPEPYLSPIDFDALWERNEDIYAWMDIPNTPISYPVVQSPEDDAYYLRRNSDGDSASIGSLFSEHTYNANDFSDLITVLYAHHNSNGTMFGNLQSYYSETDAMEKYGQIRVFLPDKELDYEVFAAVPYDNTHILYWYGANDIRNKRVFQYEISKIRSMGGCVIDDRFPAPEDPILILSTCLQGDRKSRFLVLARLIDNQ